MSNNFLDQKLLQDIKNSGKWISQNSAILVFHGIGNQKPFETLDSFVRGLLNAYIHAGFEENKFHLIHEFATHQQGDKIWYENIIRIKYGQSPYYLDCYEFYWADKTENKVSWNDMQEWIDTITTGAENFYQDKVEYAQKFKDDSIFFQDGKFRKGLYKTSLKLIGITIPMFGKITNNILALFRYIPFGGSFIYNLFYSKEQSKSKKLTNILGDIVAYNSPDPKNKLFKIRREIQVDATKSIKYLIEKKQNSGSKYQYDKIIISAHSLGTQIAFDGLNSIDHKIALGDIDRENIENLLGFITFGSHLDKAAFFFREQTQKDEYIKAQIKQDFYTFKQKTYPIDYKFKIENRLTSKLTNIQWRNYYDINDPVSGELDYYTKLTNIRCDYIDYNPKEKKNILFYIRHLYPFTHSYYWSDKRLYKDIIIGYLN